MEGLQRGTMLMSTDPNKQPKLPQHDWADSDLYITPGAYRFMEKKGTDIVVNGMYHIADRIAIILMYK